MARRLLMACLALTACLPAFAASDPVGPAIARQMEINRVRYGIVGQAVLVMRDGKLLFHGAAGERDRDTQAPMTTDSVFCVFSVSKLFVSTLIMQLAENGSVDLGKPASTYVKGLPETWKAITVRQFLSHSSGVPEYFEGTPTQLENHVFPPTIQAVFDELGGKPLGFTPGTATRYTQTNYLVLSALLEAHYGKPYPEIATERIIKPLHLDHTWVGPADLPAQGVATPYYATDGALDREPSIPWPAYAYGHASLYTTLDDLGTFLRAVARGDLVGKAALQRFWQRPVQDNGQPAGFATGWDYDESGDWHGVGHDGGARLRVRILWKQSLDGENYTIVYLTNGSAKNVWSRVLVDSVEATVAPSDFPREVVAEKLIAYAGAPARNQDAKQMAGMLRKSSHLDDGSLERTINATGYTVMSNLGIDASIRVFTVNTELFPTSPNVWDSLAEAWGMKGDKGRSEALYKKSHALQRKP